MLMTLARLRQVQSPTVRAAVAASSGAADDEEYRLELFAGRDGDASAEFRGTAEFFDLDAVDATAGWPIATNESRINLGVSTNIQSLPLNDASVR
ncbi:MAG: hypothetical protein GW859_03100 [Sphingomonadales bacterium]|nr:hypothetical protein [Sphingomonadales bacterium]